MAQDKRRRHEVAREPQEEATILSFQVDNRASDEPQKSESRSGGQQSLAGEPGP